MKPVTATYHEPPEVLWVEGEIILRGPHREDCYTVDAAARLALDIQNLIARQSESEAGSI
jgi:hypothetical protein